MTDNARQKKINTRQINGLLLVCNEVLRCYSTISPRWHRLHSSVGGTTCQGQIAEYIFILIKESGPTDKPLSDRRSNRTGTGGKGPQHTSVSSFNGHQVFFFVCFVFFFTVQSLTRLTGNLWPQPHADGKRVLLGWLGKAQKTQGQAWWPSVQLKLLRHRLSLPLTRMRNVLARSAARPRHFSSLYFPWDADGFLTNRANLC